MHVSEASVSELDMPSSWQLLYRSKWLALLISHREDFIQFFAPFNHVLLFNSLMRYEFCMSARHDVYDRLNLTLHVERK